MESIATVRRDEGDDVARFEDTFVEAETAVVGMVITTIVNTLNSGMGIRS